MTCRTCAAPDGLATCLYCGHAFCASHRDERGGVPACVACLRAEREREERAASARVAASKVAAARTASGATPGGAADPAMATGAVAAAREAPPPLVPEPPWALPWALLAAAPAGAYLFHFFRWLIETQGAPAWSLYPATLGGTALVFGGVWVIARSRPGRTPS